MAKKKRKKSQEVYPLPYPPVKPTVELLLRSLPKRHFLTPAVWLWVQENLLSALNPPKVVYSFDVFEIFTTRPIVSSSSAASHQLLALQVKIPSKFILKQTNLFKLTFTKQLFIIDQMAMGQMAKTTLRFSRSVDPAFFRYPNHFDPYQAPKAQAPQHLGLNHPDPKPTCFFSKLLLAPKNPKLSYSAPPHYPAQSVPWEGDLRTEAHGQSSWLRVPWRVFLGFS